VLKLGLHPVTYAVVSTNTDLKTNKTSYKEQYILLPTGTTEYSNSTLTPPSASELHNLWKEGAWDGMSAPTKGHSSE